MVQVPVHGQVQPLQALAAAELCRNLLDPVVAQEELLQLRQRPWTHEDAQQLSRRTGTRGTRGTLTDLGGDLCDPVTRKIKNQEALECGDEGGDGLEAGPVDLPLLDLVQLDQTGRQRLGGPEDEGSRPSPSSTSCED